MLIDSTSNLRLRTTLFWFTSKGLRNMGSAMCGGKPKVPSPRPPSADKPLGKHTQTEMPRLKNGGYRCERPCYSLKYNEYIGTSTCVFFMEYLENSIVFTSIYNWGLSNSKLRVLWDVCMYVCMIYIENILCSPNGINWEVLVCLHRIFHVFMRMANVGCLIFQMVGPVISVCFVLLIGCMEYKTQRKAGALALRQRQTSYYTA